jgi:hypothetical protein
MFERERKLYADLYGYARQLVVDVPDEQLAEQPAPGLNHPAWLLGHLTTAADFVLGLLGGKPTAPDGWAAVFAPGTVPSPERGLYPPKADLLNAFEAAHGALAAAATTTDPALMAKPNPVEPMRARFPTLGDLMAYVLTTHEATHLGQLSAWRRVMGLKGVMG